MPEARSRRRSVSARSGFECSPLGCRSACPGRRLVRADGGSAADRDAQLAARERARRVDAIIRKARAVGIGCAQWTAGSIETILAKLHRWRLSARFPAGIAGRTEETVFVDPHDKTGIADAWSGEPEARRGIEVSLSGAGIDAPMLVVSRSYLDRTVAHYLALSAEKGEAPPLGLLQVAETIGSADWQPARMTFSETLAGLIAEIPKAICEPAALASLLRRSDELADLETVSTILVRRRPGRIAKAVG